MTPDELGDTSKMSWRVHRDGRSLPAKNLLQEFEQHSHSSSRISLSAIKELRATCKVLESAEILTIVTMVECLDELDTVRIIGSLVLPLTSVCQFKENIPTTQLRQGLTLDDEPLELFRSLHYFDNLKATRSVHCVRSLFRHASSRSISNFEASLERFVNNAAHEMMSKLKVVCSMSDRATELNDLERLAISEVPATIQIVFKLMAVWSVV